MASQPRPTGEGHLHLPGASGPPSRRWINAVPGGSFCSAEPPAEPALAHPLPASIPSSVSRPCQDQRQHDAAGAGADQQSPVPAKMPGCSHRRASGMRIRCPRAKTHRLPPAKAPSARPSVCDGRSGQCGTGGEGVEKMGGGLGVTSENFGRILLKNSRKLPKADFAAKQRE